MLSIEEILHYAMRGVENELDEVEKLLESAEELHSETMIDFYDDRVNELKCALREVEKMALGKHVQSKHVQKMFYD